jgi:hypothetical protein
LEKGPPSRNNIPYEVEPIEHGAVVQFNLDAVLAYTITAHPETTNAEPAF